MTTANHESNTKPPTTTPVPPELRRTFLRIERLLARLPEEEAARCVGALALLHGLAGPFAPPQVDA
jgi:hypothetical protein